MRSAVLVALSGLALASCASSPSTEPAAPASSQASTDVGRLVCDVSKGVGMIVVQKQTLACTFTRFDGMVEAYSGTIDQYGVALGAVKQGYLSWTVLAATKGIPQGALAGTYAGVGTNASIGVGGGANVLVGGAGRSLSLQPLSVQGQTGINIAGGVTSMTLVPRT